MRRHVGALLILLGALLILLLTSCGNRNGLDERHARATAEALIATNGPKIRDFHRLQWKGLNTVSATEARGSAVMVYRFRLPNGSMGEERIPGTFTYHRKPGEGWVLERVDFPNPGNLYHALDQQVLVKVESAEVARGTVDGQIPASPASSSAAPPTAAQPSTNDRASSLLSPTAARRAALRYLAGITSEDGTWLVKGFQPIRDGDSAELELPATLLVQSGGDTLQYGGGFFFNKAPRAGWMLTRMSFRSPGATSIERDLPSPIPAN